MKKISLFLTLMLGSLMIYAGDVYSTYGSNGASATTNGNTTYGSGGKICTNYGNTTYCN